MDEKKEEVQARLSVAVYGLLLSRSFFIFFFAWMFRSVPFASSATLGTDSCVHASLVSSHAGLALTAGAISAERF